MKRTWIAMLVVAGGLNSAAFGQQYPQQNRPQDPRYNGQYGDRQYDYDQYPAQPDYNDNDDPDYYDDDQGVYAPAPPPIPGYAYQRPRMPGRGYYWVDGYWNFFRGRYTWVSGYWMLPPYAGGYWVRPRYAGGRFFRGYWGGARNFNRGHIRNDYRYRGRVNALPYRAPSNNGFRNNGNRRNNSGSWGNHGGRR